MNSNLLENPTTEKPSTTAGEGETNDLTPERDLGRETTETNSDSFPNILEIVVNGEVRYKCIFCTKNNTFKTKRNRLYHQYCLPGKEKPFKCSDPSCKGKSFVTKTHFWYHESQHKNDRRHSCHECGRRFIQKSKLARHLKTHTDEKPFQCRQCKKQFRNKGNLQSHSWTHYPADSFECQVCQRTFNSPMNMKKHIKRQHTPCAKQSHKHGKFKCTHRECEKFFQSKWEMTEHRKIHQDMELRPYRCAACGRKFVMEKDLVRHERVHTGERPYRCFRCDKMHQRKDNLLRHLKSVHKEPQEIAVQLAREAEKEVRKVKTAHFTTHKKTVPVEENPSAANHNETTESCNPTYDDDFSKGKSQPNKDVSYTVSQNEDNELLEVHQNNIPERPTSEASSSASPFTEPMDMDHSSKDKTGTDERSDGIVINKVLKSLIVEAQQDTTGNVKEVAPVEAVIDSPSLRIIVTEKASKENHQDEVKTKNSEDDGHTYALINIPVDVFAVDVNARMSNLQQESCNDTEGGEVVMLSTEDNGDSNIATPEIVNSLIAHAFGVSMTVSLENISIPHDETDLAVIETREGDNTAEMDLGAGSVHDDLIDLQNSTLVAYVLENAGSEEGSPCPNTGADDSNSDSIDVVNDQNDGNYSGYSSSDDAMLIENNQLVQRIMERYDDNATEEDCLEAFMPQVIGEEYFSSDEEYNVEAHLSRGTHDEFF